MKQHHRSRRQYGYGLLVRLKGSLARLRERPLRLTLTAAMCAALGWLLLTKSLPYALASAMPDLALALNPNNPAALIAKADQLRLLLLNRTSLESEVASRGDSGQDGDTIAQLPEANDAGRAEPAGEREELREKIRELATRVIVNDPLNARGFRLLAEVTNDTEHVRILMQEAVKHSRREAVALFWLLNDAFYRKDYWPALRHAGMLVRTRPELSRYVLSYVSLIAEDPDGMPLVAKSLAGHPYMRGPLFDALSRNTRHLDTPLKLMEALKASGQPPETKELGPYLDLLISKNHAGMAYNAWLQFFPAKEAGSLGLLTNANFAQEPSGLPFDWRLARGLNAFAQFVRPDDARGERALHFTFGSGRVQFPELRQVVLLSPGRYRLEGRIRGRIISKRGLRWQLLCAVGSRRVLGETDMLMGESEHWRIFKMEADVPQSEDCTGQTLRLFHDSRSASEEFISGELWLGGVHLERIRNRSTAIE